MTKSKIKFGELRGVKIGTVFRNRYDLSVSGVHKPLSKAIHMNEEGVLSILISPSFKIEKGDRSYFIWSESCGGENREAVSKALTAAIRTRHVVRIVRSSKTQYGPRKGYLYDGVFKVAKKGDKFELSKVPLKRTLSEYRICNLVERAPPHYPVGVHIIEHLTGPKKEEVEEAYAAVVKNEVDLSETAHSDTIIEINDVEQKPTINIIKNRLITLASYFDANFTLMFVVTKDTSSFSAELETMDGGEASSTTSDVTYYVTLSAVLEALISQLSDVSSSDHTFDILHEMSHFVKTLAGTQTDEEDNYNIRKWLQNILFHIISNPSHNDIEVLSPECIYEIIPHNKFINIIRGLTQCLEKDTYELDEECVEAKTSITTSEEEDAMNELFDYPTSGSEEDFEDFSEEFCKSAMRMINKRQNKTV